MASGSTNKNQPLLFKAAQRPHFFKIILDDSITHQKLGIPRKFVRTYGDDLSSEVTLKVPSGVKWKVEIMKSDGVIWLDKGWPEFAEYYSIGHGDFVVFGYEKSSCEFNVIIFDRSCSEIDYPFTFTTNNGYDDSERPNLHEEQVFQDPNMVYETDQDDVSVEILDNYSPSPKAKVISQVEVEKRVYDRTVTGKKTVSNAMHRARSNLQSRIGKKRQPEEKKGISNEPNLSFSNPPKAHELSAKRLRSVNQSFQSEISLDKLKHSRMHVPRHYIKNIKPDTKVTSVTLKVNNRWWPVNFIFYPKSGSGLLSGGWGKFARENSLKVGDVCTFEPIDSTDPTRSINVSIIRTEIGVEISRKRKQKSPLSSSHPQKKMKVQNFFTNIGGKETNTAKEKSKAIQSRSSSFKSENPTFEIAMHPSHIHPTLSDLSVPGRFVREYMKRENGDALLVNELDGRTWCVKYGTIANRGRSRTKLRHLGWRNFAKDNHLRVGDVCKFELIDPDRTVIRVTISKRTTVTTLGQIAFHSGLIKKA